MATKKITKLTPEQELLLPRWREQWFQFGSSTELADRQRAQVTITQMYEIIGEKPPAFLWFDSPMAACLAIGLLKSVRDQPTLRSQLDSQLYSQLGSQLYSQLVSQLVSQLGSQLVSQLGSQLVSQLGSQLASQLASQLGSQLYSQLVSQLYSQLVSQLDSQLDSQLGRDLRGKARESVGEAFRMGWQTAWAAYYKFGAEIGVKFSPETAERLELWGDLAQSCSWWWPYKGICVLSERPKAVLWDERGRLHAPTRAALEYRDGYRLFMWHGTAVPESWITAPEKLEPQTALTWQNIEQRRAAAEIIGWRRVIEQLSPKVIDADADPEIGELLEVELPDAGKARFLKVRCGTGRDFVLSVPREMKTAAQANARTFRLKPSDLKKSEFRT